jgi:hypothetical protein
MPIHDPACGPAGLTPEQLDRAIAEAFRAFFARRQSWQRGAA